MANVQREFKGSSGGREGGRGRNCLFRSAIMAHSPDALTKHDSEYQFCRYSISPPPKSDASRAPLFPAKSHPRNTLESAEKSRRQSISPLSGLGTSSGSSPAFNLALSSFTLTELVGTGEFATVHAAVDGEGGSVALKILKPKYAQVRR